MEIVRLPVGEQASVDADCIRIEEQPGATYKLTASAMCVGAGDGESVSIVGGPVFETVEQAEATGVAWAADVGVERLFVSMGTLAHPLKLIEIDKPL
jgi:hypothetical protein